MAVLHERLAWIEAEKISNILLKYFVQKECTSIPCEWLYRVFNEKQKALLRNKILTPIAYILHTCCNYNDNIIDFRIHRYQVYMKACRELSLAFREAGIELAIIKTVRAFPADIADIDIVVKARDKSRAIEVLKKLGYKLRKESLKQDLWTKIDQGVIVDVELHTNVALAGFTYIENEFIFNNIVIKNDISVPNENIEIILEAAHAVIKDLEVRLSDILNLVFYLNKIKDKYKDPWPSLYLILSNAKLMGLTTPLVYISKLATFIQPSTATLNKIIAYSSWTKLPPVVQPRFTPVKPPVYIIAISLLEKTITKITNIGFYNTIKEVVTILKSKGTDTITSYLAGKSITKDIFEDKVTS